ncbi:hypothetical protein A2954_03415 [Candidatus Roizmanbacteria bacterium RIFCSPLOWO2_01_FULL_37_12]|uniref:EfeO-type cupredoxin-like domain-containing protein n=1 Tax=Candidatus Roizmanbacteria bacterium RIFCSPLOWO2_01_FULL_37_12 TaxID=1802056 RepID=A0A1F7IFF2_9BACT|nr:MAG: hypothetical protein A2768_01885 [Candidatus Roizmanbacteria bacterium RIFCSPHIGHO2_01_FULL_37_16]OGK25319.1 MAG: hypothetical protein A3D76_00810 [Candidatus Roizmanbacteria bacterium RIFCSPHIGHO2_02_FULL_37_9b]OGK42075.1 MAG: hypothetical protein A2954_03415 [Candidatus Roizmanbacteria bacterium RIFCSPLOWO2_01_FULL_37_12]
MEVYAVHRDYTFVLTEFDISATAQQGQVTEILLPGKAVGTFTLRCGLTCSGKVNVKDNDEDSDFE